VTRTTADLTPSLQVQTGAGVDPAVIDHALDRLRATCAGYPVEAVRARLVRASGLPAAVLADATAVVHGRSIRVGSTEHCPQASIDRLCDRLAAKLQQASTTRN
jgi:hypothetical protein